jgi:hypothetical protein
MQCAVTPTIVLVQNNDISTSYMHIAAAICLAIAAAICLTIVTAHIHASKQPAADPSDPARPW